MVGLEPPSRLCSHRHRLELVNCPYGQLYFQLPAGGLLPADQYGTPLLPTTTRALCICGCVVYNTGRCIPGYEQLAVVYGTQRYPGYYEFMQNSMLIRFGIAVPMTGWIAAISMFWYNIHERQEKEQRQASTEKTGP